MKTVGADEIDSLTSINYDNKCLEIYHNKYNRIKTFCKMIKKHALGKCNCKKDGKICNYDYNEKYPILNEVKEKFKISDEEGSKCVKENIEFFETVYNCSQSVTQSLKSSAGRDFENSFEEILKIIGFSNYETQVFIDNEGIFREKKIQGKNKGHVLDFVIPTPEYGKNIKDHKGIIISVKTTARERVNQDRHLGKFTFITLDENYSEDNGNITVICIKKNGNKLSLFIKKIIEEYS